MADEDPYDWLGEDSLDDVGCLFIVGAWMIIVGLMLAILWVGR